MCCRVLCVCGLVLGVWLTSYHISHNNLFQHDSPFSSASLQGATHEGQRSGE